MVARHREADRRIIPAVHVSSGRRGLFQSLLVCAARLVERRGVALAPADWFAQFAHSPEIRGHDISEIRKAHLISKILVFLQAAIYLHGFGRLVENRQISLIRNVGESYQRLDAMSLTPKRE